MKKSNLKFVKGAYAPGEPADIFFYTDVDYWSVADFLDEFDYLVNQVKPCKLRIHINSVGGNVVEGMSVFNKIIDCEIPTECINDALAASMGSVIWAAGDELYMKDYALLMIHNPFIDSCGEKKRNSATDAFTKQIKTVYSKRFGLSDDEVAAIMDGAEGEDGTFLTADEAIAKGFLKAENVLSTPGIKEKVQNALNGVNGIDNIKAVFKLVDCIDGQPKCIESNNNNHKSKKMEKNELTVFAALFGLTGEHATSENVTARINELKAKADKLDETQKTLDDTKAELTKVQAELTGANTSIKNLTESLNDTKKALDDYRQAEAEAKQAKVNALIDGAVNDCKISKEERDLYVKMAENDFDLAVNVLSKIPAKANLGKEIADANLEEAKNGMQSEEEKIQAKVNEVVGNDFKFRTIN